MPLRKCKPFRLLRVTDAVSFTAASWLLIGSCVAAPQADPTALPMDEAARAPRTMLVSLGDYRPWPISSGEWTDEYLDQVAIGGAALVTVLLAAAALRRQRRARMNRLRDDQVVCRLIAENTNDMILRIGADGGLADKPRPSARALAWFPEASRRQTPWDVIHPADRPAAARALSRIQSGEPEVTVEFRINRLEQAETWIEAVLRTVRHPVTDLPDGYVAVFRNVTEHHRLEAERNGREKELHAANDKLDRLAQHLVRARDQAERASRAKSRFLAGMSHELRTPLNGILGYARLLRMEGGLTDSQEARLCALLKAGDNLLQMITCVLDLSEIEANHLALQTKKTDIKLLAAGCLDLVRPAADAKGLSLTLAMAPGTEPMVVTDGSRLRQVLLNLLDNAVKFTASGAVELRLRPMAGATALRIEVTDTGPGIDSGQRSRLFQDFERLAAEALPTVAGAGLGLAVSARLAVLLGGQLGHDDNPAGGSTFWLDLPTGNFAPDAAGERDGGTMPALKQHLHVLVVDDVAMNRDIAGSFLRSAGHTVTSVDGGAAAIAEVKKTDFDVVLMDVRMPEMDGLEATRQIRAMPGPRGQVPIIALTAMAFSEQVAECRKAGMDDHLAKPFEPDTLVTAVKAAAGLRRTKAREAGGDARATVMDPASCVMATDEPAVLDLKAFERTAAFLAPDTVSAYLQTIAERAETLLARLRALDAPHDSAEKLAEAAHSLAGSAGMFGFERAAAVSRRFENAIQSRAPDVTDAADDLAAALEATLREIAIHPAHASRA